MTPIFSIALCTYNSLQHIEECVHSLLTQTLKDFELIIVDDGSTDGTLDYLNGLKDARIRIIDLKKNHGLIYARTQAFKAAQGKYIALMDSDDIAHPERLEKQFEVLRGGSVDICATRYQTLDTATGRLRKRTSFLRNADLRALLTIYCPICNPTASFRRELVERASYSDEFRHAEDYAFWATLSALDCTFQIVPAHLLTYRVHPQQISRLKSEAARTSFLKAQRQYIATLLGSELVPKSMKLQDRLAIAVPFMLSLNRKLRGIGIAANYEIYAEFQYRRNGWRTPFLRLERLLVAALSSATGLLPHSADRSSAR